MVNFVKFNAEIVTLVYVTRGWFSLVIFSSLSAGKAKTSSLFTTFPVVLRNTELKYDEVSFTIRNLTKMSETIRTAKEK